MIETLLSLLSALNALSPLGVIALLGVVLFFLAKERTAVISKVDNIADNHLHDLPEILATLQRMEVNMSSNFEYIKAKLNGK